MAYSRFPLPCLKLTQRPAFGQKSVSVIQRGVPDPQQNSMQVSDEASGDPSGSEDSDSATKGDLDTDYFLFPTSDPNEPTTYELEQKSSVAGWEAVRSGILTAVTELQAMPVGQTCLNCENTASLRCQRCGPFGFFCEDCFQLSHYRTNLFHIPEKWENGHYVPLLCEKRSIDVRPIHCCATKRDVPLECIDEYGIQHAVNFSCCACEPIAITLARGDLWPATPHNPRLAFSFALLDWAEALMLECQVALKDFCKALYYKCPFSMPKRRDVYSSLINSFEEYRYFKHNLRHMNYLCEDLDSGSVCPACPQSGGKFVYAMDALFGLPRKKSAGVSYRDPLHDDLFFCSQSDLDQFVADRKQSKSSSNECNNFLAGSMLRSASRYKALDETAVFGFCCHEFPGKFINLKHGERLAYAVWMLERIITTKTESSFYVMYDIACTLFNHLKSSGRADLLEKSHLCLPIFHSYGHKVSCQVLFGPRRCEGIGLSDGETMERLWSYLRRFGRMTKEMRPSHRIDVLSSALVFYGIQTKDKLGILLLTRWERAIKTKMVAEETLDELMPEYHDTPNTIRQWIDEEETSCHCTSNSKPNKKFSPQQAEYFHLLQTYYAIRSQLASGNSDVTVYRQLTWLNAKLEDLERKLSLSRRWVPSDVEFKECEHTFSYDKKQQLLLELLKASQRRMFLLKLKKKYADGQKIAKKLCVQISKETRTIRSLLADYHACQSNTEVSCDFISLSEALNPCAVGDKLQVVGVWCSIATGDRRAIIDAYLTLCRSKEEISMLTEEARNVTVYYEEQKKAVSKELDCLSSKVDSYSRGATSLLHQLLAKISKLLEQSYHTVKVMNTNPNDYDDTTEEDHSESDLDPCSDIDTTDDEL